eukprot:gb/GECG01006124.1/.p1 GENE.gb/GECG01006124.1/~~gb/GECG01006124.1/.p1  ORF type:complete len:503 (+),score=42.56 gb/GECG01006124.1/:1-1509(+)
MLLQFTWDHLSFQCFQPSPESGRKSSRLAEATKETQQRVVEELLQSDCSSPELINFCYNVVPLWDASSQSHVLSALACRLDIQNSVAASSLGNHLLQHILLEGRSDLEKLPSVDKLRLCWSISVFGISQEREEVIRKLSDRIVGDVSHVDLEVISNSVRTALELFKHLHRTLKVLPVLSRSTRESLQHLGSRVLLSHLGSDTLAGFASKECLMDISELSQTLAEGREDIRVLVYEIIRKRTPHMVDMPVHNIRKLSEFLILDSLPEEIRDAFGQTLRICITSRAVDLYGFTTRPTHPIDLVRLSYPLVVADAYDALDHIIEIFASNYRPHRAAPLRLGEKAEDRGIWRIPAASLELLGFQDVLQLAIIQTICLRTCGNRLETEKAKRHTNVLFALIETSLRRFDTTESSRERQTLISCFHASAEYLQRCKGWWVNRNDDYAAPSNDEDDTNISRRKISFEMMPVEGLQRRMPANWLETVGDSTTDLALEGIPTGLVNKLTSS